MSLLCLLATRSELRAGMAEPAAWLADSEAKRLAALGTPDRRESFLAGRWLARLAVQRWCGVDALPALRVAESGACHVVQPRGVHVSISHSGDHVACAVAAVPVGVDIERVDRPRDHLALASMVHSEEQQATLRALPPSARARCFLQDWTLKEAWLKAREQGLDFAVMRALAFDDDPEGDAAVTQAGELILAIAARPALPLVIDAPPGLSWRRCRSRQLSPG